LHAQKKYEELNTVLHTGTKTLLFAKRWNEATELGNMLISSYTENHTKPSKETIGNVSIICALLMPLVDPILELYSLYSNDSSDAQLASETFMKNAIKWSVAEGENKLGDPSLHYAIAEHYLAISEYGKAQKHYLRSGNPTRFAKVLYTWAQSGYSSEADLFIARAVLQYLCFGNLKDANTVYQEYLLLNTSLPQSPLINCLRFLLLTLERDAYPLFEIIRKRYRISIERDPSFQQVKYKFIE
jgi:tetratricopeptide (TPR) repeat protein